MNIAVIDIMFIVIIAFSALRCAARGFVSELLSIAAFIIGILAAIFFFRRGAVFVRASWVAGPGILPDVIAFAAIFLIVFVTIKLFEMMLKSIIDGIQLGGLDRFLGFIFGCVEGLIIVCLLLFIISVQPVVDADIILGKSVCAKIILPFIMDEENEGPEPVVLDSNAAETAARGQRGGRLTCGIPDAKTADAPTLSSRGGIFPLNVNADIPGGAAGV